MDRNPSINFTTLIQAFSKQKSEIETLLSSPLARQSFQSPPLPTPNSGNSSHFSPMAITPQSPTVEENVATPMETSPATAPQNQAETQAITIVGERIEPLKVVESFFIDTTVPEEAASVNAPTKETPTVHSEKGSSSIPKKKKKVLSRRKPATVGIKRRSSRIASAGGSPSYNPAKKAKPSFIDLSEGENLEKEPKSPASNLGQNVEEKSDSGSEFDDTESDQDFKAAEGEDESSEEESDHTDEAETLKEFAKKIKKAAPRNVPTSTPTKRPTPEEVDEPQSDSEMEVYENCHRLFLTTDSESRWRKTAVRKFICEKKVDRSSFIKYNMLNFLIQSGMMSSVSYAAPFADKVVKLFYNNITRKFGNMGSKQYGKTYVRGRIYDFTPALVNDFFGREGLPEQEELDDMNDVVRHISGGRVTKWTNDMKVSCLTAMHNVLHKLTITNWLPSSNTTIVTKDQAILIYKLSCGAPIDLGQIIFERIWQEAESQSARTLSYLALIYKILESQGFVSDMYEPLTKPGQPFKITSQHTTGDRVIDLPWIDPSRPASSTPAGPDVEENVGTYSVPHKFLMQELERCNDQIKFYGDQLQRAKQQQAVLLEILSSQKGGESSGGEGDKEGDDDDLVDLNLDDVSSGEDGDDESEKTLSEDRDDGEDED